MISRPAPGKPAPKPDHDLMMDRFERKALEQSVRMIPPFLSGLPVVEIGAGMGLSGEAILRGLGGSMNPAPLYSIDPCQSSRKWLDTVTDEPGSQEEIVRRRMAEAGERAGWTLVQKPSDDALEYMRAFAPIAWLLIDGEHKYAQVKKDLRYADELLVVGGILAMHDMGANISQNMGPTTAYFEWFDHTRYVVVLQVSTLLFLRKIA